MHMNLKIRSAVAVSVALVGLSISTNVYAAPAGIHVPVHAMFDKTKLVKFNLRNDSNAAMELKVGDNVMTLEAGKTVAVKLPIGARIVMNATTPTHDAGTVLAQVSSQLDNATIGFK
jgi:hypothetical protein